MRNPNWRATGVGLAAAVAVAGWAVADAGGRWEHHGMGGGGRFFGPFMMILFIALIVVAIVVTAKMLGYSHDGRTSSRARTILDERFASGEIDKADYEERKKALAG